MESGIMGGKLKKKGGGQEETRFSNIYNCL